MYILTKIFKNNNKVVIFIEDYKLTFLFVLGIFGIIFSLSKFFYYLSSGGGESMISFMYLLIFIIILFMVIIDRIIVHNLEPKTVFIIDIILVVLFSLIFLLQ